ncbi:hypothetical protein CCP4SC76_5580018 [Gammaproteobacteria bacterium]
MLFVPALPIDFGTLGNFYGDFTVTSLARRAFMQDFATKDAQADLPKPSCYLGFSLVRFWECTPYPESLIIILPKYFPFAQNIYQKFGISSHFDSKDGLILRQLLHYLIRHPSSWRSALFEVSNLITF